MSQAWKIVGSSEVEEYAEPDESFAFELIGDQTRIVVPLQFPLSHAIEERLWALQPAGIVAAFQSLIPPDPTEGEDYRPGWHAPPFPETDADLPWFNRDGTAPEADQYPWTVPGAQYTRPTNWEMFYRTWYFTQRWYGHVELVKAFGEAVEALTGLPLELSAPLLYSFTQRGHGGPVVSESKPASTSNGKGTGRRSSKQPSTS
jgi:hypothetical protein